MSVTFPDTGIKFFQYDRAQPHIVLGDESGNRWAGVSTPQGGNINGCVEQGRLHLFIQHAINVFNFDAAPKELLVGFAQNAVSSFFRDHPVQRPFEGFRFRFCAQGFLGALDLC
jgi:hypothetical protein